MDQYPCQIKLNYTVGSQDKDIVTYNKSIPNQTKQHYKDIFKKELPIDLPKALSEYNYVIRKK